MKKKYLLSALYSAIIGITLYIPFVFVGYLPYMSLSFAFLRILLYICILIGAGLSTITILHKCNTPKHALVRTGSLLLGLFLMIAFNGEIGTIRTINRFLGIVDNVSTDRAAGMAMYFFMFGVFCACMIANVIVIVKKCLRSHYS